MAEDNKDREREEVSGEDEDELPLPPELIEEIPKEIRPKISKEISMALSMTKGTMPMPHPLISKLNSQHIDKIIDYIEQDDIRSATSSKSSRRYIFAAFCLLILVGVVLAIFFQLQGATEILINLVIGVFSLAGGFGIGRYFQK